MRRWLALPLLFVLGISATSPDDAAQALAQPADPVEETFRTADGLQLAGLFHKSQVNPANDPVVIMMYPPGKDKDMSKGDWKGLANRLAAKGFNVFRFDWRGHGKSTDIKDTTLFWNIPTAMNANPNRFSAAWNLKYITGAPVGAAAKKKIKNDIFFKDFKEPIKYSPTLLNDLAAVRYHLDTKNDAGELNTSSIYLIGSEVTATLGIAWMTAEWNRPKTAPNENALFGAPRYDWVPQPLNGSFTEAGEDISGAIWLSGTRATSVRAELVKDWVARGATKLRDNNHMLFLYGGKDQKAEADANFFYNQVLVANPPKTSKLQALEFTKIREIKEKDGKATALSGVALLGNDAQLETETTIVKFLEFIQKDRAKIVRKNRNFDRPYFIDLSKFGLMP